MEDTSSTPSLLTSAFLRSTGILASLHILLRITFPLKSTFGLRNEVACVSVVEVHYGGYLRPLHLCRSWISRLIVYGWVRLAEEEMSCSFCGIMSCLGYLSYLQRNLWWHDKITFSSIQHRLWHLILSLVMIFFLGFQSTMVVGHFKTWLHISPVRWSCVWMLDGEAEALGVEDVAATQTL